MQKKKQIKDSQKKKAFIYIGIFIILLLIISVSAIKYNNIQTAKCIGENSQLFIQPGSNNCKAQLDILGNDIKYFNFINCFSERNKCDEIDISKTPVWIINKEKYYKVLNTIKLKELTDC